MASNLDYLDPALLPLEEKVGAYLTAEKALRRATNAGQGEVLTTEAQKQTAAELSQSSATEAIHPDDPAQPQALAALRANLDRLEQEIIALLPTRDEWLKVNLGYGPSRVGAWLVPALDGAPERYKLRVIH